MSALNAPHFQTPEAARKHLEAIRWPDGPVCPHCGSVGHSYVLKGKSSRPGVYKCGDCRKQYSVTVGTVFERSKISLHVWLQAVYLLCSSKKGISSHQLHRTLGVTYKTAWFMSHRIREAMREGNPTAFGGSGSIVEVDEVYIGGRKRRPHGVPGVQRKRAEGEPKRAKRWGGYGDDKEKVVTLVERGGRARSFHVPRVTTETLRPILWSQLNHETALMTDESTVYPSIGRWFASHDRVNHGIGEYVRGRAHTNTVEGYFSILKRGLTGVYQHCSAQHLKRYVGEFDFRYTNREQTDAERTDAALRGIEGKRLTYREPSAG